MSLKLSLIKMITIPYENEPKHKRSPDPVAGVGVIKSAGAVSYTSVFVLSIF